MVHFLIAAKCQIWRVWRPGPELLGGEGCSSSTTSLRSIFPLWVLIFLVRHSEPRTQEKGHYYTGGRVDGKMTNGPKVEDRFQLTLKPSNGRKPDLLQAPGINPLWGPASTSMGNEVVELAATVNRPSTSSTAPHPLAVTSHASPAPVGDVNRLSGQCADAEAYAVRTLQTGLYMVRDEHSRLNYPPCRPSISNCPTAVPVVL